MLAVYYSLAPDAHGVRERQWVRSVCSIRAHNREVPLVLCLYGSPTPVIVETAARENVRLVHLGDWKEALGDIPTHWREALGSFPTLHKLASLRALVDDPQFSRLLFLDCDTYAFDDVAVLATRHNGCNWFAREEPFTRRSPSGYLPEHVDEDALAWIAHDQGLVRVPPYNTGVMLLDVALARTLVTLLDDFVWYTWRLLVGAALWRPQVLWDPAMVNLVRSCCTDGDVRMALPYPSGSGWIIEEVATWLTLGRVPGLQHNVLDGSCVSLGGEYGFAREGLVLAHYFSAGEAEFLAALESFS